MKINWLFITEKDDYVNQSTIKRTNEIVNCAFYFFNKQLNIPYIYYTNFGYQFVLRNLNDFSPPSKLKIFEERSENELNFYGRRLIIGSLTVG